MVQALSVFIDTLIICSCTACIILLSGVYQPGSELKGIALTRAAVAGVVGEWGRSFVSVALMLFAFTSIIYNHYLGENSLNFFSNENRTLFTIYRVLTLVLVMWGSQQDLSTVFAFAFADLTMDLLALVNLAALAMLFRVGMRILRDYDRQIAAGVEAPVFDAAQFADLNLDREAWIIEQAPPATAKGGHASPARR
ncbi:Na+/alanine symporter [Azospirillum sp. BE72]|nr:Na+/alanine symporter [Azospirillum sp. BE72]